MFRMVSNFEKKLLEILRRILSAFKLLAIFEVILILCSGAHNLKYILKKTCNLVYDFVTLSINSGSFFTIRRPLVLLSSPEMSALGYVTPCISRHKFIIIS